MGERRYSFGPYVLDAEAGTLSRDGAPVNVGQRGIALLTVLLDAGGNPFQRTTFLSHGWPGLIVEEANLSVQIAALLLKAQQINKSDRHDARGIAQMMRVGLFKPVHVKTLASQEKRMLLTARKLVQRKMLDVDADLRGTLRNFGLKVGVIGQAGFETRIRELVEGLPRLAAIVEPLLTIRRVIAPGVHQVAQDAARRRAA